MLVLTRKQNDKIQIGDQITITVLRMKGKAVRLGIEAPADVNVMRGELVFDLSEEKSSNQEELQSEKNNTSSSPISATERKSQRYGLEVGQVAADRWPAENPGVPTESTRYPSMSAAPLAEMVSLRPH